MKRVHKVWDEEDRTMEFTEKMETCETSGKYDIILDIVKVNTDEEIGA